MLGKVKRNSWPDQAAELNRGWGMLTVTAATALVAERFKRWLAKVGYERIQEIKDPELATRRTRALYQAKGYSEDWIEKRMRSIAIRDELTDEWKKRGVREQREYAILTAGVSSASCSFSFPRSGRPGLMQACALLIKLFLSLTISVSLSNIATLMKNLPAVTANETFVHCYCSSAISNR